jgi:hypothetical protein
VVEELVLLDKLYNLLVLKGVMVVQELLITGPDLVSIMLVVVEDQWALVQILLVLVEQVGEARLGIMAPPKQVLLTLEVEEVVEDLLLQVDLV